MKEKTHNGLQLDYVLPAQFYYGIICGSPFQIKKDLELNASRTLI